MRLWIVCIPVLSAARALARAINYFLPGYLSTVDGVDGMAINILINEREVCGLWVGEYGGGVGVGEYGGG